MSANINKTIRQSEEIISAIVEIRELNPSIKDDSDVIPYAYRVISKDIRNRKKIYWERIQSVDFNDNQDIDFDSFGRNRRVILRTKDYETVLKSYTEYYKPERVKFSYLSKLCVLYTLDYLRTRNNSEPSIFIDKLKIVRQVNQLNIKLLELLEYNKVEEAKSLKEDLELLLSKYEME